MNEIVVAVLIVWISMAIPSIAHGVVLARRSEKSVGLAVIVCLVLPWLGLLFFINQPPGERRVVGLGYYCASMLTVVAIMAIISIFPPWIIGDPAVLGEDGYAPRDLVLLGILVAVWALSLIAGSLGITRGGDMVAGVALGVVVSLTGGILVALINLWGSAGVFVPDLREMQSSVEGRVAVGPGGWLALVALVVAYVCVTLLPFGLRLDRQAPATPQPEGPPQQQWAEQGWPQEQEWSQQPRPPQTGAGW